MPRNKRVAREVKSFKLRIEPDLYDMLQEEAAKDRLPMNSKLEKILLDFFKDEANKK